MAILNQAANAAFRATIALIRATNASFRATIAPIRATNASFRATAEPIWGLDCPVRKSTIALTSRFRFYVKNNKLSENTLSINDSTRIV